MITATQKRPIMLSTACQQKAGLLLRNLISSDQNKVAGHMAGLLAMVTSLKSLTATQNEIAARRRSDTSAGARTGGESCHAARSAAWAGARASGERAQGSALACEGLPAFCA